MRNRLFSNVTCLTSTSSDSGVCSRIGLFGSIGNMPRPNRPSFMQILSATPPSARNSSSMSSQESGMGYLHLSRADAARHRFQLIARQIAQHAAKPRCRVFRGGRQLEELGTVYVQDLVEGLLRVAASGVAQDAVEVPFGQSGIFHVPQ